jgi:hypothetical protein
MEDHRGVQPSWYTRAAAIPTAMCPALAIAAIVRAQGLPFAAKFRW